MACSDAFDPLHCRREREELGYTQNLLVDPCKGNGPGCCEQVYGTPEYREKPMDATSRYADGTVVSSSRSRWPANEKVRSEAGAARRRPQTSLLPACCIGAAAQ